MNHASTGASLAFEFRTKAQNLQQLEGRLHHSHICECDVLTVAEWEDSESTCVQRLQERFSPAKIIVRSSATDEDSVDASMAGAFDSRPNIDSSSATDIAQAIAFVVDSYREKNVRDLRAQEILTQPMVPDVILSGVLFTRDLGRNLPYYVINYEESDRTDSVTSGTTSAGQRTYRIYRGVDSTDLSAPLDAIVLAAREIEEVSGSTAVDVEFAMDRTGRFYLLQVRPLVRTLLLSSELQDRRLADQVRSMKESIAERFQPRSGLYGSTTALGEMPDWNPAEIIGTHPTPLAASLYRHLIMRYVWREARGILGYNNPVPHQLLVTVAGRPYVDVRCSANSLLPRDLAPELADKLVDHYIDRLHQNPELHDKIEFEIFLTSHTFDIEADQQRLRENGFSESEISVLWKSLFDLTDRVVRESADRTRRFEADVAHLTARRQELLRTGRSAESIPYRVDQLLEDCRHLGTAPFSVAARCAFIAMSFLRSLVSRGVMTQEGFDRYTHSIDTVASSMVHDLNRFRSGEIPVDKFLGDYGHLRPGTYDVRAFSYADRPHEYLSFSNDIPGTSEPQSENTHETPNLRLDEVTDRSAIAKLITEFAFGFDLETLDEFIKASVRQREWLKFEFSKNLSSALDLVAEYGRYHGMSRDDIAFVNIDEFLQMANESSTSEDLATLKQGIDRRQKRYELTSTIPLPDLIFQATDIEIVSDQRRKPNFVTQKCVTAKSLRLESVAQAAKESVLVGKIILIENADPGYDWLFSKGIAGLCTKYGGAASHMTIRCAEFGTPAAIGCGGQIFAELEEADMIRLDCQQQVVEPYGT